MIIIDIVDVSDNVFPLFLPPPSLFSSKFSLRCISKIILFFFFFTKEYKFNDGVSPLTSMRLIIHFFSSVFIIISLLFDTLFVEITV